MPMWLVSKIYWMTNAPTVNSCARIPFTLITVPTTVALNSSKEGLELLKRWLHQDNWTYLELAYCISKYLIFQERRNFAALGLGSMFPSLQGAAVSQDQIGLFGLLYIKVLKEIANIQA